MIHRAVLADGPDASQRPHGFTQAANKIKGGFNKLSSAVGKLKDAWHELRQPNAQVAVTEMKIVSRSHSNT